LNSFEAPKYSLENSKILCIQKSLLEIPNFPLSKSQIPAYNLNFHATKETPLSILKTILGVHPFPSHFQTSNSTYRFLFLYCIFVLDPGANTGSQ
jgi:hypothetical protein